MVENVSLMSCGNQLGSKICAGALAWLRSTFVRKTMAEQAIQIKYSVNVDVAGKKKKKDLMNKCRLCLKWM
jgi:hypothetical protein